MRFFRALQRAALALVASLAMLQGGGCASLPDPPANPPSHALADNESTALRTSVQAAAPAGGRSGFGLLIAGEDALAARVALADQAQRTLDVQSYAIHDDRSSAKVIDHLLAAAARGVRVRVLVDDLNTTGNDGALRRLLDVPNVEVRLYNPFPAGRFSTVTRILASLTDFDRINRRMHVKLFVADNAVGITGGRNIGDAYFVHSDKSNFVDLDLVAVGAAVKPMSAAFDAYWNHRLAYPARMFITGPAPAASAAVTASPDDRPEGPASDAADPSAAPAPQSAASAAEAARAEAQANAARDAAIAASPFAPEIPAGRWPLVWAPARVFADSPTKIDSGGDPAADETLADDTDKLLRSAHSDAVLITPYFVPGERAMALFRSLRERGVAVRILTNSLASTDAPAVHVGYARYREDLLKIGVSLHELQVQAETAPLRVGSFQSAESKLHAKALVIDGSVALVGSMNFDPRSAHLNTEMGVLMRSPVIAQQVIGVYEDYTQHASYRLWLDDGGDLRWTSAPTPAHPQGEVFDSEPGASLWLRLMVKALAPLAPEDWL